MKAPKTQARTSGTSILFEMLGERPHLHDIDDYIAAGGYEQLRRALGMETAELIDEVKASGIRGRGGAGFPSGLKMSFIPVDSEQPKYLVCNADESEPGTAKDREIMERQPHLLIEGCLIAAAAIRSQDAFIYIRGEYLEPYEILVEAARQAQERGFIGPDVAGSGRAINLIIHRGAGAYICGEETGLLSSLNGDRGQPTVKPPFPAISGLYQAPTLVNNVETLASLPRILEMGGEAFGQVGPNPRSTGTRVFTVSGCVQKPGNFEVELGAPMSHLVNELAGGVPEGRTLKAVIPGGSSMPVILPDQLDTPLDYDRFAALGTSLGSGAVVVLDDSVSMPQLALRVAEFYRHESCGKCTPCREGTSWAVDILTRICSGNGRPGDTELLEDVCERIDGNCLCPLGEAMAWPTKSYIRHFREEFHDLIRTGRVSADERTLDAITTHVVDERLMRGSQVQFTGRLDRGSLPRMGARPAAGGPS